MQIKTIHAHFLISIGSYSNERIGFSVNLEEGETADDVVPILREQAKRIVGRKADELYSQRNTLYQECSQLEQKLNQLRKEWEATAAFLKAQGLNPDAPSMPQFRSLLTAVNVESETVLDDEDYDHENDDYDEDDEDYN